MTVIRCTNKLLKLLAAGSASTSSSEPADDDWYANLLWIERRKCLLAAHAGTLFAFFEPDITKAQITPFGSFLLGLIDREVGLKACLPTPLAAGGVRFRNRPHLQRQCARDCDRHALPGRSGGL